MRYVVFDSEGRELASVDLAGTTWRQEGNSFVNIDTVECLYHTTGAAVYCHMEHEGRLLSLGKLAGAPLPEYEAEKDKMVMSPGSLQVYLERQEIGFGDR
jgi:hypothetical protein